MSRNYLIVYILVVLFASQTHAGYREMRTEIEAYEPPSVLQNGNDSGRDKIETAIDTNFMEELNKIREIKVKWEKSLKATDEDFSFIRPDPERLEKLHPAKFDPDKAADAMKDEYSLATLETLALLRNPGVMAAENRFLASVEMFSQVSALDEILRQYTAFTESLMPGVGESRSSACVLRVRCIVRHGADGGQDGLSLSDHRRAGSRRHGHRLRRRGHEAGAQGGAQGPGA